METFIIISLSLLVVVMFIVLNFYHNEIGKTNKYINELTEINETHRKEIKFQAKVNKTLREGLDFYTKKHKEL